MSYKEPENRKTIDEEVFTVILIAVSYFGGNIETAISVVRSIGLISSMLNKSRFNYRMHKIGKLLAEIFFHTGEIIKSLNISHTYAIDSFLVAVCHNIRIPCNRILKEKADRGYCVSKRCYFYGFNVHVLVITDGIPVEYTFTAGSKHDMDGIRQMTPNLPASSQILVDAAYTDYEIEEMLADNDIRLLIIRNSHSKQPHYSSRQYLITIQRKRIETTFSDIAKLMPKSIHAVTAEGF
jgi:hypothetical protein